MPPAQKPGNSIQNVGTPDEFILAVQKRFGNIDIDLAGDLSLHVVPNWLGPGSHVPDSLTHSWQHYKFGFLNPPFGKIAPWVEKAYLETQQQDLRVGVLLPAALETNWFLSYVYRKASVFILRPRLTFKNHTNVFPKGLMFCVYSHYTAPGILVWDWKTDTVY